MKDRKIQEEREKKVKKEDIKNLSETMDPLPVFINLLTYEKLKTFATLQ